MSAGKRARMKCTFLLLVFFAFAFVGCSKSDTENLPNDNGCIERILIAVTDHSMSRSDIETVHNLFKRNAIDDSKFRYYRYTHGTLQTLYPPFAKYDEKSVRVDQYANGVRIFNGDLVYHFLNDNSNFRGGNLTKGTSLNTLPRLNLKKIRVLFLTSIQQFDKAADKFSDSCFKAEFGYFNINGGTNNEQEVLVKAWRVTPKNSIFPSEYPVAFYYDNDGKLISYNNGIQTFK